MSYFISVTTAERDYFLDEANFRYMRFVIDPSGTPVIFTPMKISCDASADYQQWKFDIKNKLSVYSVGQYANEPAVVQFSDDGTNWTKIFTGFVSDEGFRRTRGFITDDQLSMTFVDATKRKGTKHKPNPVLLAGFKIVDTATTSASILHYLATQMGVTVNATTIDYTKVIVELGESTVWEELKKLQNTFHADMYFDVDGYLLFVSPFDTGYSDPTAEWTFQGDPANSVTGAASWIKGKLEEIYLPIRANYAFSNFDELEQLSSQVIYKNTESYNSVTDQISIEIAAGEYWPGGTSATDLARLKYVDPESGEEFPFATSVITPTLGAAGSGSDIESTGGTLVLTSFDGSTTATSQNANASEIILQNTGGVTCTIKKLTVRGTPYRLKSEQEIKFTDATISNDYDYVEKEIDGKYVTSSSQVFDTLYRVVQEGKGRPRQFRFSSAFMPWIQRNAIVNVQPHDESAVRCRIDSYQHRNEGKTLHGMYTSIICTELGTYTPTGSPLVKTEDKVNPVTVKINSVSTNADNTSDRFAGISGGSGSTAEITTGTAGFTIYADGSAGVENLRANASSTTTVSRTTTGTTAQDFPIGLYIIRIRASITSYSGSDSCSATLYYKFPGDVAWTTIQAVSVSSATTSSYVERAIFGSFRVVLTTSFTGGSTGFASVEYYRL